jgi:hypothetical protein
MISPRAGAASAGVVVAGLGSARTSCTVADRVSADGNAPAFFNR